MARRGRKLGSSIEPQPRRIRKPRPIRTLNKLISAVESRMAACNATIQSLTNDKCGHYLAYGIREFYEWNRNVRDRVTECMVLESILESIQYGTGQLTGVPAEPIKIKTLRAGGA